MSDSLTAATYELSWLRFHPKLQSTNPLLFGPSYSATRYGQPRSGPDRYRPGPTNLRPSRIEPILLVQYSPSVSARPIVSVNLICLHQSVRSDCMIGHQIH